MTLHFCIDFYKCPQTGFSGTSGIFYVTLSVLEMPFLYLSPTCAASAGRHVNAQGDGAPATGFPEHTAFHVSLLSACVVMCFPPLHSQGAIGLLCPPPVLSGSKEGQPVGVQS